jgi:hypothetical protein
VQAERVPCADQEILTHAQTHVSYNKNRQAKVHTVQTKSTSTVCVLSSCLALKIYKRRFGMIGGFTYNQIQWPHVTSVSQAQHKLKIAVNKPGLFDSEIDI